jgi:hypothetical protein
MSSIVTRSNAVPIECTIGAFSVFPLEIIHHLISFLPLNTAFGRLGQTSWWWNHTVFHALQTFYPKVEAETTFRFAKRDGTEYTQSILGMIMEAYTANRYYEVLFYRNVFKYEFTAADFSVAAGVAGTKIVELIASSQKWDRRLWPLDGPLIHPFNMAIMCANPEALTVLHKYLPTFGPLRMADPKGLNPEENEKAADVLLYLYEKSKDHTKSISNNKLYTMLKTAKAIVYVRTKALELLADEDYMEPGKDSKKRKRGGAL